MPRSFPRLRLCLSPFLSPCLAPCLSLAATALTAEPAALSQFSFAAPHHGHAVDGAVWYPAGGPGAEEVFAENPVFRGISVQHDAEIAGGAHPVVLLSHGLGGGIRSMAWLAAGLAEQGAIVVAVTHPNTTWSDFDLAEGIRHWTRVQDLTLALDTVQDDPRFAAALAKERVMAAGFSYGGWTALSLGGARGNLEGMIASCTALRDVSDVCERFLADEVGLAEADPVFWDASWRDPRVTSVAAIEPGFTWGLTDANVADVDVPVTLIGLGDDAARFIDSDFEASGFAALLPDAEVEWIVPGHHFTAMPMCTEAGQMILEAERDDPVCTDPAGTDRAAVHARIVARLAAELGL